MRGGNEHNKKISQASLGKNRTILIVLNTFTLEKWSVFHEIGARWLNRFNCFDGEQMAAAAPSD